MHVAHHQGRRTPSEPNWKEKQRLGARIEQGYRLACQFWLTHDIELSQEAAPLPDATGPLEAP